MKGKSCVTDLLPVGGYKSDTREPAYDAALVVVGAAQVPAASTRREATCVFIMIVNLELKPKINSEDSSFPGESLWHET
jgi:hypothetical protein